MTLRSIPSVERLLKSGTLLTGRFGRPLTLRAINVILDEIRAELSGGSEPVAMDNILARVEKMLEDWTKPILISVINATGVILHTNLGRAPLSQNSILAIHEISSGYSNLELDITTGKRGSRQDHIEPIIQKLTGAEACLVVNNCASAVLLVLSSLANRKKVVIARSQLVEIGGGFRIPDVMKQSGARLVEVGTTNKVKISDYEDALLGAEEGLLMRAHRSNFKIVGFTEEPSLGQIADVAHHRGSILVDDLGSGALLDTSIFGMEHEPTVQESIAAGADLVMFSGDKLLGGPQAGIIIGRSDLIARIKRHPLSRALRADKSCLSGLSATLMHYLKDEAEREIPIWRMISRSPDNIRQQAELWLHEIGYGEINPDQSTVGGGSLPGETLPTWAYSLEVRSPDKLLKRLRNQNPAIIARASNDRVVFDPRTVLPEQNSDFISSLKDALK
jgi:L-seryl-tRNA(Ser) seleniumtransferase